jgi:hypothetical protein
MGFKRTDRLSDLIKLKALILVTWGPVVTRAGSAQRIPSSSWGPIWIWKPCSSVVVSVALGMWWCRLTLRAFW